MPPTGTGTEAERTLASDEESGKIRELRTELAKELEELHQQGRDYPHTTGDIWLLRVLRGNGGSVAKAAIWYRRCLDVRKEHGLDEIFKAVKDKPYTISELPGSPKVLKYLSSFSDEANLRTANGDLLHCDVTGGVHWEKFQEEVGLDAYLQWQLHVHECKLAALDRLSRETGRIVKLVGVVDLTGMRLPPKEVLTLERNIKAHIFEATGAEVVHRIFFLGAPRFFHGLYRVTRPMLPARTREKITVYGRNYAEDPEVVAEAGKPLLSRILAAHHAEEDALSGQMRMVSAGGVLEKSLAVSAGQRLYWAFRVGGQEDLVAAKARGSLGSVMDAVSSGTDLFFEVSAVWDDEDDNINVPSDQSVQADQSAPPSQAVQSVLVQLVAPVKHEASPEGEVVQGSIAIERSGTAILKWTNVHSWVRAKVLASFEIRVESEAGNT